MTVREITRDDAAGVTDFCLDACKWTSIGFEHDQALVTRYFPEGEGC